MFIRKNKKKNGSVSIQIIQKIDRRNKVIKTIGCAKTQREEELLCQIGRTEIDRILSMPGLFYEQEDLVVDSFVESISNDQLQIVGPQIVLGKIYEQFGFIGVLPDSYFKDLVICRLAYPGSKLKTISYFKRHLSKDVSVYTIYRFMDELNSLYKAGIELKTFEYFKKILRGRIGVVFYDMTTLYFEASEEDELRVPGYSKDGKHNQPQIMIGLLVGGNGYPIGYEIFQGNTAETKTLIPVLEYFQNKYKLEKPIVIADAALLSKSNLEALKTHGYKFILGGRIKNETEAIKQQILSLKISENNPKEIKRDDDRLIITYSSKRSKKDLFNRKKGLKRLESKVVSGKLTKENINNRGYNKYLSLKGETTVSIDYNKFNQDNVWDGMKGYVTNTKLSNNKVVKAYSQLWHIEKAFRISKTDLKIRPVYHRLKKRIEAHICICFTAYAIYKELERHLNRNKIELSPEKAIAELNEIKQLTYRQPKSQQIKTKMLKLSELQAQLLNIL